MSQMNGTAHGFPKLLYRAAQVRELDRTAIDDLGIRGYELMNRAASAAFAALRKRWPGAQRLVVLCGSGNNGGDGFVLARLARAAGLEAEVYQPAGIAAGKGDALTARRDWEASGGIVADFDAACLDRPAVVVDSLLGTGLERPVGGSYADVISAVNRADLPVLALDIPSGLDADTGRALGCAVRAGLTVTFVGLKLGLFTGEAPDYTGTVRFAGLGIPDAVYARVAAAARRISLEEARVLLRPRRRTAHKGHHGHVLVVGGNTGMAGAARMAGEAAARSGAGLVSVATRQAHAAWIGTACPELMCHGIEDTRPLSALLARATVVAVGPGLGQDSWARRMLGAVLDSRRSLIVDADALNLLATEPVERDGWVLTPHPGEAARLLESDVSAVQTDRFSSVRRLQARFGGVVVLKGAGTLVCDGSEQIAVCAAGNPGMASGGMGDVLTGVIAGLAAQGITLADAARVGVFLHASAGDTAATDGERGMLATDLLPHLRRLANPGPA